MAIQGSFEVTYFGVSGNRQGTTYRYTVMLTLSLKVPKTQRPKTLKISSMVYRTVVWHPFFTEPRKYLQKPYIARNQSPWLRPTCLLLIVYTHYAATYRPHYGPLRILPVRLSVCSSVRLSRTGSKLENNKKLSYRLETGRQQCISM